MIVKAFSMYGIMSSANNESFTSFPLIWVPFIMYFCLISVVIAISDKMSIILITLGSFVYNMVFPLVALGFFSYHCLN